MKEGTESNVKFKKLKRRLNLREWETIGVLEAIWKLTRTSCPAGDIGKFSNEDIAAAIEWSGDADELIGCLVACGWIDEDEEFRLIIHDWSDHVPTYLKGNFAKHNKQFANEVAKQRAKQVAKQPANEAAEHVATKPSLVKPSQAESSQANVISSEPGKPASKQVVELRPEDCKFPVFPCSGKGAKTWEPTESQIKDWEESYPAVDVRQQLRESWQWIKDNLANRKSYGGYPAYVNRWFARNQDRGGRSNGNGRGTKPLDSRNDQSVVGTERGWSGFHK